MPTNTKVLSEALKAVMLSSRNRVKADVKTFKRGVLPPRPVFPAVAIMPTSMEFQEFQSGGRYLVNNLFDLEFYTKGTGGSEAIALSLDLGQNLKMIFKEAFDLDGLCEELMVGDVQYSEIETKTLGVLQKGVLPINILTEEFLPENREILGYMKPFPDSQSIIVELYNNIAAYSKQQGILNLSEVKSFNLNDKPTAVPAISIMEDTIVHDRSRTDRDDAQRYYEIKIFTSLSDNEATFDLNLRILAKLIPILQLKPNLDGLCYESFIDTVHFNRERRTEGLFYTSTLNFSTISSESRTFTGTRLPERVL